MSTRVLKYPFDPTASSSDNLCTEERQIGKEYNRALAPYAGDFYADTMVIRDLATGKPLIRNVDFVTVYPNDEAERRTGMPVHAIAYIKNRDYDKVRLEYQVVGGLYSTSTDALISMMNELIQDSRKVSWDNIFGKPTEFNPTPHLHHASDIYGMEFVVLALEELCRAIIEGDNASHDILYDYINRVKDSVEKLRKDMEASNKDLIERINKLTDRCNDLEKQIQKVAQDLTNHINDRNNPHKVTKEQLGLKDIVDLPLATKQQAEAGSSHEAYMTPLRSREGAIYYWTNTGKPYIDNHLNDFNNPHKVSKAQIGLANVENYVFATQTEAVAGVRNDRYMSPLRVKEAITQQAVVPLNNHIGNYNNPHKVTREQIKAMPDDVKINGKPIITNPTLGAHDVGTLTEAEIRALIKTEVSTNGGGEIKMGPKQEYRQRNGSEIKGTVLSSWADFGGSTYRTYHRALYYKKGGEWVLVKYD